MSWEEETAFAKPAQVGGQGACQRGKKGNRTAKVVRGMTRFSTARCQGSCVLGQGRT